jgi:hypothetical protein
MSIDFENDGIDRWARGDLGTSRGRLIEPFGPMLGSHCGFSSSGLIDRSSVDTRSVFYESCRRPAIMHVGNAWMHD